MAKIAVLLTGSGRADGSEIHESVLTLLRISQNNKDYQCISINKAQVSVVNHFTGKKMEETKNQLIESARIARGDVVDIKEVKAENYDALIIPGGNGTFNNLAVGEEDVVPELKNLVNEFYSLNKPIGAICIAPVLVARILGEHGIKLTIGNDSATAVAIESFGAKHVICPVDDCVVDIDSKTVSTPAYMLGPDIGAVSKGIFKLVDKVIELI